MIVMDYRLSVDDLREMFPHNQLDTLAIHKEFGPAQFRIYAKFSGPYPEELHKSLAIMGAYPVFEDHDKLPITWRIVRDLWRCTTGDALAQPQTLTIVSSDPDLIPIAKALRSLGVTVQFVACKNIPQFNKEGFQTRWLNEFSSKITAPQEDSGNVTP